MDSGNSPNQQQRYCPTPMAPPSVATSPPIMGGGNIIPPIHQPPHHPPPSISPHPAAYYGHHTAAGASHYPTPSPTPPPMHHQQYYHPSYYAHGSHQQAQQQSQQSQHHGISTSHVSMTPLTPQSAPPQSVQQGQHQQHPHLMGHTSYHHAQQAQTHQQWPGYPQQQSHHYYHQLSTHHQAQQQQQLSQQPQQHGYPPPPHSPYAYVQAHTPAPTPPPHSPHPPHSQSHQLQQQQQHPPSVPPSPGPTQMHQQQTPQQTQQSHALMNLSRFVNQQNPNPSPCPSPRASPSLASHHSQVSQMAPQSPSPFSGHSLEHHSAINGHTSTGPSSPVMSPPPPHVHSQQAMSPPPPQSLGMPVSPHQLHLPSPPVPYGNINGSSGFGERSNSSKSSNSSGDESQKEFRNTTSNIKPDHKHATLNKELKMLKSVSPKITSDVVSTKDSDSLSNKAVGSNSVNEQLSSGYNTSMYGSNSMMPNSSHNNVTSTVTSTISSSGGEDEVSSTVQNDVMDRGRSTTADISGLNASGATTSGSGTGGANTSSASCSPPQKPTGSPTNAGNGHQMMPVRLQNMQKGARTKASMKKLMQEQHLTTPNGQGTESSPDPVVLNGKGADVVESMLEEPVMKKGKGPGKGNRTPRKKKSQTAEDIPGDNAVPTTVSNDLTTDSISATPTTTTPEIKPGYTKAGKKIGRPRKDSLAEGTPTQKIKGKRGSKLTPNKKSAKKSPKKSDAVPVVVLDEAEPIIELLSPTANSPIEPSVLSNAIPYVKTPKQKTPKASRKRSSKVLVEGEELQEKEVGAPLATNVALVSPVDMAQEEAAAEETVQVQAQSPAKRRKKSRGKLDKKDAELTISLNNSQSSEITEEEAESVVSQLVQPVGQAIPKSKIKRRKSISTAKRGSRTLKPKQKKLTPSKRKKADKEVELSPERSELPRLRSRSPKQRESPPLRISSPRAAKERSMTPATSTNPETTRKSRASKEKEVAAVVKSPLSSPILRSPKKSPEKEKGKAVKESRGLRQKLPELSPPILDEMLSPPPTKRTRQMSKESTGSVELHRGRRKSDNLETRLSSEPDKLLSPVGKRTSRRKSGSGTGSIDSYNLSSPSFNQSDTAVLPSEILFEVPAADSLAWDSRTDVPKTDLDTTTTAPNENLPAPLKTASLVVSKRRKGKKLTKAKSKSQRPIAEAGSVGEGVKQEAEVASASQLSIIISQVAGNRISVPSLKVSVRKPRKPKKISTKKTKKTRSTPSIIKIGDASEPAPTNTVNAETDALTNSLVVKEKKKRKVINKKAQHQGDVPLTPPVLNIPAPSTIIKTRKKELKPKTSKLPRQPRKRTVKGTKQILNTSQESSSIEESSVASLPENDLVMSPPDQFSRPGSISPTRRRSSSVVSPNTQSSAKSSTPDSSEQGKSMKLKTEKATPSQGLRRDSRSLSRDYDVSVVLTDIAQSLTSGELSLSNISTNSVSRQPSHSPSAFLSSTPLTHSAETSTSITASPDPPVKVETSKGKQKAPPAESIVSESVESLTEKQLKKKRELKVKAGSRTLPTQKKIKLQNKMELQERKAKLEAEVAQVLLELQTGTSSKSPSPAKSIPGVELPVNEAGGTAKAKPKRRKSVKLGKRKNSTGARRSIDSFNKNVNNSQDSINQTLETSVGSSETSSLSPLISVIPRKVSKRKSVKGRRLSKTKKSSLLGPQSLAGRLVDPENAVAFKTSQSMNMTSPVQGTSVKVSKTAVIPTSSSLITEEDSVAVKRIVSIPNKKSKNAQTESKRGTMKGSPDITDFNASSDSLPVAEISTEVTKRKRKKAVKTVKSEQDSVQKDSLGTLQNAQPFVVSTDIGLPLSSPESPIKKKRQRKTKTLIESATVTSLSFTTETTTGFHAVASTSTSKLFPYQSDPKPAKKPTVFTKSTTFFDEKSGKGDDNQKRKTDDTPTIKVVGGLAKFFRGGEEEEVDPDPKLPKEKAPLQTDNAVPWVCSFCHLGPHAQKLGDLFGPYFADMSKIYGKATPRRETWMHGDCALWAGRLLFIGTHLRRLEETLRDADEEFCTICGKTGATIGCLRRGCKKAVHFPCAIRRFWKMDEQDFHSYCPDHAT